MAPKSGPENRADAQAAKEKVAPAAMAKREAQEASRSVDASKDKAADTSGSDRKVATTQVDSALDKLDALGGKNSFQRLMERAKDPKDAVNVLKSLTGGEGRTDVDYLVSKLDVKQVYGEGSTATTDMLKTQLIAETLKTIRENPSKITESDRKYVETVINTDHKPKDKTTSALEGTFGKGSTFLKLNEKTIDANKTTEKKFAKLQKTLKNSDTFKDLGATDKQLFGGIDVMTGNVDSINHVEAIRAVERLQAAVAKLLNLPPKFVDGDFGNQTRDQLTKALKKFGGEEVVAAIQLSDEQIADQDKAEEKKIMDDILNGPVDTPAQDGKADIQLAPDYLTVAVDPAMAHDGQLVRLKKATDGVSTDTAVMVTGTEWKGNTLNYIVQSPNGISHKISALDAAKATESDGQAYTKGQEVARERNAQEKQIADNLPTIFKNGDIPKAGQVVSLHADMNGLKEGTPMVINRFDQSLGQYELKSADGQTLVVTAGDIHQSSPEEARAYAVAKIDHTNRVAAANQKPVING